MVNADPEVLADALAETRVCNLCLTRKPLDCFHVDRKMPLGRRAVCRVCRSQHRRALNERRRATSVHRTWSKVVRALDSGKLNCCARELVDALLTAAGGPEALGAAIGNHLMHAKPGDRDACRAFGAVMRLLLAVHAKQPVQRDLSGLPDDELAAEMARAGLP